MPKLTEQEQALNTKLKGVMDFYISTYFEHYSEKIKDEVAKHNLYVEQDMMDARIQDSIQELVDEASHKFHQVVMLILDTVIAGREHKVREFEVLFIDLVRRTLIEDMKEANKEPIQPIVIIANPEVNAKEN